MTKSIDKESDRSIPTGDSPMPIGNIWSLQPGECLTAEEIMKETGCDVFFPLKDVGIDLVVVKDREHVGVQVKESRYYHSRTWKSGHIGHSWHDSRRLQLELRFATQLLTCKWENNSSYPIRLGWLHMAVQETGRLDHAGECSETPNHTVKLNYLLSFTLRAPFL